MTVLALYGGRQKRDFIETAFEELGSAGYEFERTPEEVTAALRRLNMLMAEWSWSQFAYNFPISGNGTPEDESGIADSAFTAVAYELARRLAGLWGVTFSGEQRKAAADAKAQALPVSVPRAPFAPNTVRGSGSRLWGYSSPFINEE